MSLLLAPRRYIAHAVACGPRGDIPGALATILDNPPYGSDAEEAKVRVGVLHSASTRSPGVVQNLTLQTLVTVLNSTKSADIPTVVKSLTSDHQDNLMKYLYKGMAIPGWGDVSGSVLLGWHEKV